MPKILEPTQLSRRRRVGIAQRGALGEMIEAARLARGWTRPRLARAATCRLRASEEELARGGMRPVEVTPRVVECLEWGLSTLPLGNAERRARLLGIVLALELDRAEVNLIAGGI